MGFFDYVCLFVNTCVWCLKVLHTFSSVYMLFCGSFFKEYSVSTQLQVTHTYLLFSLLGK